MGTGPEYFKGQRLRNKATGAFVTVAAVVPLNGGKQLSYRLTDTGNGSLTEAQVKQRYDVVEPVAA